MIKKQKHKMSSVAEDNRGKTVSRGIQRSVPPGWPWWSIEKEIWWNSESEDWWYADETAGFCGPHDSKEEAREALEKYAEKELG